MAEDRERQLLDQRLAGRWLLVERATGHVIAWMGEPLATLDPDAPSRGLRRVA